MRKSSAIYSSPRRMRMLLVCQGLFVLFVLALPVTYGRSATYRTVALFDETYGYVQEEYPEASTETMVVDTRSNIFLTGAPGGILKITPQGRKLILTSRNTWNGNGIIAAPDGGFYGWTRHDVYHITASGSVSLIGSSTPSTGDPGSDWGITSLCSGTDGSVIGSDSDGGTGCGSIFKIPNSGTETDLYTFHDNGDGSSPLQVLQSLDGNLYGRAMAYGYDGRSPTISATIFKLTTDGTFSLLIVNGDTEYPDPSGEEAVRIDTLIQGANGNLYATDRDFGGQGGFNDPNLFQLSRDGNSKALIYFTDGSSPNGPIVQDPTTGIVYGICAYGGSKKLGEVYACAPDGTFHVLYSFKGRLDGAYPTSLVMGPKGRLYGIAHTAGKKPRGSLFEITLPTASR